MATTDSYRLVIGAKFDGLHTDYLVLDTVKERTVNSSATIATHPVQSGSSISDHMWSQPDTVSFSGTFSLVGSEARNKENNAHKVFDDIAYSGEGDDIIATVTTPRDEDKQFIRNYIIEGISGTSDDRLTNIQETFEYIKDNGVLCDLMTIIEDGGKIRFKQRSGMALEKITWTEKLNSMNYNFEFKEVMAIDIPTFEWSTSDIGASLELPSAMSISELLKGNGSDIFEIVIAELIKNGYLLEETARVYSITSKTGDEINSLKKYIKQTMGQYFANEIIVGVAGIGVAAVALAAGASIVPVGTIIVGIAAALIGAIAIARSIKKEALEEEKRKIKIQNEVFKLITNVGQYINGDGTIKDSAKNAEVDLEQVGKLNRFIRYAECSINKTLVNITAYSLTNTLYDDKDREIALTVGEDLYYLSFIKDDSGEKRKWNIKVLDANEKELNGTNGILGNNTTINLYDLNDCNNKNYLFLGKDERYKVYIVNPSLNPDFQTENKEKSLENVGKYLTGTNIIVSHGNIKDILNQLSLAILSAAQNFDYGE